MRRRPGPLLALGLVWLAFAGAALAGEAPGAIRWEPAAAEPGAVLLLTVRGVGPDALRGFLGSTPLAFFATADGAAALAGADLDLNARELPWQLVLSDGVGSLREVSGRLPVTPREFSTQHLTLPREQVDLDPQTLARVKAEAARLGAALGRWTPTRFWRGAFAKPVEGQETGGFGMRRIINGQPRSPHAGFDWAAPAGTPVMAANAGIVVLVDEQFFPGRLVVLDHGLGLFTLYFHLQEVEVVAGERVSRGQRIGRVGATGRVTGPHLHFAVRLAGARVDPQSLLRLPLPH